MEVVVFKTKVKVRITFAIYDMQLDYIHRKNWRYQIFPPIFNFGMYKVKLGKYMYNSSLR